MWIIKVTHESDFHKNQSCSIEHRLTDLHVDHSNLDVLTETLKQCVRQVQISMEDPER
jgi:hypothetical protein